MEMVEVEGGSVAVEAGRLEVQSLRGGDGSDVGPVGWRSCCCGC